LKDENFIYTSTGAGVWIHRKAQVTSQKAQRNRTTL
jgi:hypothetical protein